MQGYENIGHNFYDNILTHIACQRSPCADTIHLTNLKLTPRYRLAAVDLAFQASRSAKYVIVTDDTVKLVLSRAAFYSEHTYFIPSQADTAYQRPLNVLHDTLSIMPATSRHLALFTHWQHQPRINRFWELGDRPGDAEHYFNNVLNASHKKGFVLYAGDNPFAYLEVYNPAHEPIGQVCQPDIHDSGLHFLSGNKVFLGRKITTAVLQSCLHFIYLSHKSCEKIWAEPRTDNTAMIKYANAFTAWQSIGDFALPHKQARLLCCHRTPFMTRDI